jgi:hypothetical protein
VHTRTACDRLVGRLLYYGKPRPIWGRWTMGMLLLGRAYEGFLSGKASRRLPVDGIKDSLVAHGQSGQFYRHLHFHVGCRFLGWPGILASRLMHQVDVLQAARGRLESVVEARGNIAAFACADVLLDGSRRMLSRRETAAKLRQILAG